jgi:hypothetical protein
MGVLTYYSDAAEDCSLFVEQARWIAADGSIEIVPGLGVLLTKSSNIKSISFLDEPPAEAAAQVENADDDGSTPAAPIATLD